MAQAHANEESVADLFGPDDEPAVVSAEQLPPGQEEPAEEVNLFFLLETIIGPLWVWLVINEQPSIETIQGGVVIILTIAIHSFLKLKNTKRLSQ